VTTIQLQRQVQRSDQRPRARVARRALGAVVLLSLSAGSFSLRGAGAQDAPDRVVDEAQFVSLINQVRAASGAEPLVVNQELARVARQWTLKMKSDGDISHNPELSKQVNASWRKLGENVGVGPDVPMLHDAFIKSPAHLKNIVDPAFDQVAVTIEYAGDVFFVTQQFMDTDDRTASTAKPTATPAPSNGAPNELALKPGQKSTKKKPPTKKKTTTKK
jgi:hypothetical protein